MLLKIISILGIVGFATVNAVELETRFTHMLGIDVNGDTGSLDWQSLAAKDTVFAWIHATEGDSQSNPKFAEQYAGAVSANIIRGAYHTARPDLSSGSDQAEWFVDFTNANDGTWVRNNATLPAAIEFLGGDDDTGFCYGLSAEDLAVWQTDFYAYYKNVVGRTVIWFTSEKWWVECTGDYTGWGTGHLWVKQTELGSAGKPFGGFTTNTFWQYQAPSGTEPGLDLFNLDARMLVNIMYA